MKLNNNQTSVKYKTNLEFFSETVNLLELNQIVKLILL